MSDPKAGEIAPYLVLHYQKIIEHCLLKHSKRPGSNQVRNNNIIISNFIIRNIIH